MVQQVHSVSFRNSDPLCACQNEIFSSVGSVTCTYLLYGIYQGPKCRNCPAHMGLIQTPTAPCKVLKLRHSLNTFNISITFSMVDDENFSMFCT